MVIGVMSDTHGNGALMLDVARLMTGTFQVEAVFHLGDDYRDALDLRQAGFEVRMVPGLWCPEYHDSRIPKRLVEDIEGLSVVCAHADRDLRHIHYAASIILTGHTHVARIEHIGFSLYVSPGHLKSQTDRGERPSFATVNLGEYDVTAAVHETSGRVRFARTVPRSKLA